jgi:hypothetical protein
MKTTEKTKPFDAVKMMRDIRDQIDKDTEGMTFEQEKKYFEKGAEKAKKYQKVGSLKD